MTTFEILELDVHVDAALLLLCVFRSMLIILPTYKNSHSNFISCFSVSLIIEVSAKTMALDLGSVLFCIMLRSDASIYVQTLEWSFNRKQV